MSKVDAQRAMREAKYARDSARGLTRREAAAAAGTASPAAPTPAAEPVRRAKVAPVAAAAPQGERCGHKSMNGRECTREAGHPEKNHRYS
ncbi:MAG: hypothetical protein ACRYG2_13770 [Janthinobacterium lividum]